MTRTAWQVSHASPGLPCSLVDGTRSQAAGLCVLSCPNCWDTIFESSCTGRLNVLHPLPSLLGCAGQWEGRPPPWPVDSDGEGLEIEVDSDEDGEDEEQDEDDDDEEEWEDEGELPQARVPWVP